MHTHTSENLGDITLLLHRWSMGSRDAENELFEAVFPNLRRLARHLTKGERRGQSPEPTELVNQIYFRLAAANKRNWQDRRHFFSVAVRAMRHYLIDCARFRRNAEFVSISESGDGALTDSADLELVVAVGCLLDQLADLNPTWCVVVALKYFLGLADEEAAETTGIPLRTMQRMCADARHWLIERVDPEGIRRRRKAKRR